MRAGLVIYGSLETLTGGYLCDRRLLDHLASRGDQAEVVSLPWRSYPRHLTDNVSPSLIRRLRRARFDVLLRDELNHPSLVLLNHRRRATSTASARPRQPSCGSIGAAPAIRRTRTTELPLTAPG
ncbi:MAG: hypothetical protein ACRD0K_10800 [Egibacteraceae bacterium]